MKPGQIALDARCPLPGCGRVATDTSPADGEVVVKVAASGDPARVYCGGGCATLGIAHVELGHHRAAPREALERSPRPGRDTSGGWGPGQATQERRSRLQQLGVTTSQVRDWARANGIACGDRGMPGRHVIDAYVAAHRSPAAVGA